MNYRNYFKLLTCAALFVVCAASFGFAQNNAAAPRQEKLLNGLKVLIWNQPQAGKASVKLRIHSGAAFDTKDKTGTMALLADILFPTPAAREFFVEELDGSLDVASNYDYIQISATGKTDQLLTLLETISTAVSAPPISPENFKIVRDARIEKVKTLEKNPAYVADLAVAKRLFGDFPYGRSAEGTGESLLKIDRADLLLARERFFTADNATLVVSGNVSPDYVYRAVRQFFGNWKKAGKLVPATFAAPNEPDKSFLIKTSLENTSELRYAFRGLARNDKDFFASQILRIILQNRMRLKSGDKVSIEQTPHVLPGLVTVKLSDWNVGQIPIDGDKIGLPTDVFEIVGNALKGEIKAAEFDQAKTQITNDFSARENAELWLDADTFKLASVSNDWLTLRNVSLADAQRVADRWKKEPLAATLLLTTPK